MERCGSESGVVVPGPAMFKERREDQASLPERLRSRQGLGLRRQESGEACGVELETRNRSRRLARFGLPMRTARLSSRVCPDALLGATRAVTPVRSDSGSIRWPAQDMALKPSSPDAIAVRFGQDPGVAEESRNAGPADPRPSDPAQRSRNGKEDSQNRVVELPRLLRSVGSG